MKKITKKIFALVMVLSIVLSHFLPVTKVFATSYGEGDYFINMDIANDLGFTIDSVTVNSYNWTSNEDEFHSNNDEYHIVINVSGNETTGDKIPKIQYGGNWNDYINPGTFHDGNSHSFVLDLTNTEHQGFLALSILEQEPENNNPGQNPNPNDPNPNNPNPGEEPHDDGPHFDGKAYLIWSCKSGGICMRHFDNIPDFDDGKSTFYKASEIVDERTNEAFDINAKYMGWSTDEKFNEWVNDYKSYNNITDDINWADVNPEDMLSAPIDKREYEEAAIAHGCSKSEPQDVFMGCVDEYLIQNKIAFPSRAQLQPVGEPQYKNAYVSYGDRNFKVVVYNDKYKGVSYGNLSNLNYYPAAWANAYIMRDQFDISETTKEKPAQLDAILLESTLYIEALNYNGFEISELEALDVPKDAVKISKVEGKWKIEFSSNFYDQVVFKAKDNNGEESYFLIKRYTIDGWIRNEDNKPILTADFFYDNDPALGYTHESFTLTAKIILKDGTTKNVTLEPVKRIDDGLGNITEEYEIDEAHSPYGPAGKGLMRSVYEYALDVTDKDIKDIYLNAEFTGSTKTHYAGAFSGSGKGVLANIYHGEEE